MIELKKTLSTLLLCLQVTFPVPISPLVENVTPPLLIEITTVTNPLISLTNRDHNCKSDPLFFQKLAISNCGCKSEI